MEEIIIGGTYRHFKGNIYKVIGIARHSETEEKMVVYKSIKNGDIWVRPIKMWNEYLKEKQARRFTLIES